jgi:hypothetical protein
VRSPCRKLGYSNVVMEKKREELKKTRAEKKAERRAMAVAVRATMVVADPRGTHTPRATRPITPEDVEEIITAVAEGDTVIGKCRELGLSTSQFLRAKDADDISSKKYERARRDQAEMWGDDIVEIADAPIAPILHETGSAQSELTHRALRVNTRRWLMGKYNVKFADKQTTVHEGNPDKPVVTKDVTEMSAQEMIQELQDRHRRPRG